MSPTLDDLFPSICRSTQPVDVRVGEGFEAVVLPMSYARQAVRLLAHIQPHPVGAAIARRSDWVLILPPGSGWQLDWPQPVQHLDSGALRLPPVVAGAAETLRWARFGNESRRAFTAPLLLHAALWTLKSPDAAALSAPVPFTRTPVRI